MEYGWHHRERVEIQAQSDDDLLVRYVDRPRIARQHLIDEVTGKRITVGPVVPWAWVPERDIDREVW